MLNVDFTAIGRPVLEDLTSQVDGVAVIFTTTTAFTEVERVFWNGNRVTEGDDYSVTAPNTITFSRPPPVHPLDGATRLLVELIE
jgi:hypothetical protein